MSIDLKEAADLFHTIAKLCAGTLKDNKKTKDCIIAAAECGVEGLQRVLGVDVDGIVGPVTRRAMDAIDLDVLLEKLTCQPSPVPPTPTPVPPHPLDPTPHADEYADDFAKAVIDNKRLPEIKNIISHMNQNESRYQYVATTLNIPYWPAIAVVHNLESGMNFNTHLHNGDPLSARTIHVPAGRPKDGRPPFTWEASAIDALRGDQNWDTWRDWTPVGIAYLLEKYNGFGYRKRGMSSPYLWAGSSIYKSGLYVSDGQFDPNAVSKQIGGMTIIKFLSENA